MGKSSLVPPKLTSYDKPMCKHIVTNYIISSLLENKKHDKTQKTLTTKQRTHILKHVFLEHIKNAIAERSVIFGGTWGYVYANIYYSNWGTLK